MGPTPLHERFNGIGFAAATSHAYWLWAQTGSVFLDLDEEIDVANADLTAETLGELAEQWQQVKVILRRKPELASWF